MCVCVGGGGVVRGLSRGGKTWLSMFCITFCRQLACACNSEISCWNVLILIF